MNFGMDYASPGELGGLGQGYSNPGMMYFGKSYEKKEEVSEKKEEVSEKLVDILTHMIGSFFDVSLFSVGVGADIKTWKEAIRHFIDIPENLLILVKILGLDVVKVTKLTRGNYHMLVDFLANKADDLFEKFANKQKFGRRVTRRRKTTQRKKTAVRKKSSRR